jgi:hypothetical protein
MHLLSTLWGHLSALFAVPAFAGPASGPTEIDEAEAIRQSAHDVTREQLGITHWTFHTLF